MSTHFTRPSARGKITIYPGTHDRDPEAFNALVSSAASMKNMSRSSFCVQAIEKAARAVIKRHEMDANLKMMLNHHAN